MYIQQAMRNMTETVTYKDGTQATGTNLPKNSPNEQAFKKWAKDIGLNKYNFAERKIAEKAFYAGIEVEK